MFEKKETCELTQEELIRQDLTTLAKFLGSDDAWLMLEKEKDYKMRNGEEGAEECAEYSYVLHVVNPIPLEVVDLDPVLLTTDAAEFFDTYVGTEEEVILDHISGAARWCADATLDNICDLLDEYDVQVEPSVIDSIARKAFLAASWTLGGEKYNLPFYRFYVYDDSGKIEPIKKLTVVSLQIDGENIPCIWMSHKFKKYDASTPYSEMAVIIDGSEIKYGRIVDVMHISARKADNMDNEFKKAYHVADEIVPNHIKIACIVEIAKYRKQ